MLSEVVRWDGPVEELIEIAERGMVNFEQFREAAIKIVLPLVDVPRVPVLASLHRS